MCEACSMNNWWISEIAIQDKYIHIVEQVPPQQSMAEVAKILIGE
jgi:REP element-mobilizing transposase RayT